MDEKLELIKEVIAEGSVDEKLNLAEELIADNRPAQAQNVLDSINARSAKWHFLQSRVFFAKNWLFESKKQLEAALELEPDNAQYIEEMEKLNELGEAVERCEEQSKTEMGKKSCRQACLEGCGDFCGQLCAEDCCYCICTGICEGLGSGC